MYLSESDVHLLSEEEQERPDDSAGEHLKVRTCLNRFLF